MNKVIYLSMSLLFIACASKRSFQNDEILEYASYQMNCDKTQLKIINQLGDISTVKGCDQTVKFEKYCSLGPCYLLRSE